MNTNCDCDTTVIFKTIFTTETWNPHERKRNEQKGLEISETS